jgi:hypothetical protein
MEAGLYVNHLGGSEQQTSEESRNTEKKFISPVPGGEMGGLMQPATLGNLMEIEKLGQ